MMSNNNVTVSHRFRPKTGRDAVQRSKSHSCMWIRLLRQVIQSVQKFRSTRAIRYWTTPFHFPQHAPNGLQKIIHRITPDMNPVRGQRVSNSRVFFFFLRIPTQYSYILKSKLEKLKKRKTFYMVLTLTCFLGNFQFKIFATLFIEICQIYCTCIPLYHL